MRRSCSKPYRVLVLCGWPVTRGSCRAATPGYVQVPRQGTCAIDGMREGSVSLGLGDSTSQLTLGRSPTRDEAAAS